MELDDERRRKGLEALAAISGSTGAAVVEGLKDIASDLATGSLRSLPCGHQRTQRGPRGVPAAGCHGRGLRKAG